jgi:hypothetical protein
MDDAAGEGGAELIRGCKGSVNRSKVESKVSIAIGDTRSGLERDRVTDPCLAIV